MNRQGTVLIGIVLILLGILGLAITLGMPVLGFNFWHWGIWRLWPLFVVGAGLLFVLPPFVTRGRRSLGALFIPGIPILATGCILLLASLTGWWRVWAWLWPAEVLAVAFGFLFAAIYTGGIWLLVPAVIIGLNGLLMQFCALTGLWNSWAVLWTIEPLSLGLAFLIISAKTRSRGLSTAGIVLCTIAGLFTALMITVLGRWWLINMVGAVGLVLVGVLLLFWGTRHRRPEPATHAE